MRKQKLLMRPKRPKHGPLFTSNWLYSQRRWVLRMNDRGQAEFDRIMANFDNQPIRILSTVSHSLFVRASRHHDREAVSQAALDGLLAAVRCWTPEGGGAVETLMGFHVRQRVRIELRGGDGFRSRTAMHSLDATTGDDGQCLHSLVPDRRPDDETAELNERWAKMQEHLGKIDPRHRDVLLQRFFHERTLEDIAAEMGITRERVRQIQTQAIASVRFQAGMGAKDEVGGKAVKIFRVADPAILTVRNIRRQRERRVIEELRTRPGQTLAEIAHATGLPETYLVNRLKRWATASPPVCRAEGESRKFSSNPRRWYLATEQEST